MKNKKLGEILVEKKILSEEKVKEVLLIHKENPGKLLGTLLVEKEFITKEQLNECLFSQVGFETDTEAENLENQDVGKNIDENILKRFDPNLMTRLNMMPIRMEGETLLLAMKNPNESSSIDYIKQVYNLQNIKVIKVIDIQLAKWWKRFFSINMESKSKNDTRLAEQMDLLQYKDTLNEANVPNFVNKIFNEAVKIGSSDVHFDCFDNSLCIRFRMDGMLKPVLNMNPQFYKHIISRIKIISKLDITEKKTPQDGRIQLKLENNKYIDLRVSIIPTYNNEKIVIRLLDKTSFKNSIYDLGLNSQELALIEKSIIKTHGLILVTGPTGSGKTTTLYSMIQELNDMTKNIITIEDPVEYSFEGLTQVQVNDDHGLSFNKCLRSTLRLDPDVIMVGEIRDEETAEVCVRAALTGHLVLATAHTNDAATAAVRLLEMKVKPYLLASALTLVIAQRLLRKICPFCKKKVKPEVPKLIAFGFTPKFINSLEFYTGVGCSRCSLTGFKGRISVVEILPINNKIRELILRSKSASDIYQEAIASGMTTLFKAALMRVKEGSITFDEALKVLY